VAGTERLVPPHTPPRVVAFLHVASLRDSRSVAARKAGNALFSLIRLGRREQTTGERQMEGWTVSTPILSVDPQLIGSLSPVKSPRWLVSVVGPTLSRRLPHERRIGY
jgi:hypothetical protein